VTALSPDVDERDLSPSSLPPAFAPTKEPMPKDSYLREDCGLMEKIFLIGEDGLQFDGSVWFVPELPYVAFS
jgi:hypothetical protein